MKIAKRNDTKINSPCKDCITYVLCRSRFLRSAETRVNQFGQVHGIWFAYCDMLKEINCVIGKQHVDNLFNELMDITVEKRQQAAIQEILDMFNIPRL